MKKMTNRTTIAGKVYQHALKKGVTGPTSAHPNTEYINGNLDIATDDAGVNIVTVHFSYCTAKTGGGKDNATYKVLSDIIDGKIGSVMANNGPVGLVKIDSAIGLNDFYTDRDGKEELVSAKRNEGGFVHVVTALEEDEKARSTFEADIVITGVTLKEADPEKDLPEKAVVKGAIFDFRNALLPVEFSVLNPNAISYFEGLDASTKNPVFTKVKGRQISEVVVKKITEEGAFGEPSVREVKNNRKDYVITWAAKEPYVWDDEETITAQELMKAMGDRQTYLATVKQRQDEYKASKNAAPAAFASAAVGEFKF